MNNSSTSLVLIDSHVHIHGTYDLNIFFESVFNNFSYYASRIDKTKPWKAFLLLTEMYAVNYFGKLYETNSIDSSNKYIVQRTEEKNSVRITSSKGNEVFVISGKQIIAKNNIEVLALCTNKEFDEQQSLSSTIKLINVENGIAVLPWGVGKWSGKRKESLNKFLIDNREESFFLGDNSGRPTFWSEPDLFKIGNQTGHFVLPGTDALSIPSEVNKTATYGFYVYDKIDKNKPTESIKNIITNLTASPKHYGRLEKIGPFFKNQIIMQLNKKKVKSEK